jgi:Fe-S-cluster-containing dehydrogenase component
MDTDRRSLLKTVAAAATLSVIPAVANARERRVAPTDAVGLLYDTTRCVGCKACVVACKEANQMAADVDGYGGGIYDAPEGLNEYTRNVIQLERDGDETSFVKKQCMHCVDPACVGACMLGAMHKGAFGIVSYDPAKCVGCRYCETACPFNVPKFEWAKKAPKIVKCELCRHRLAQGKEPACTEVCPRGAVIFGNYADLLNDARARLAAHPGKYVPKIYGEHELGGTQVLYLSHVPFDKIGLPTLSDRAVPDQQRTIQHGIYQGFIAPIALYGVLGAVLWRNRRKSAVEGDAAEKGGES